MNTACSTPMTKTPLVSNRRKFIASSLQVGAGTLLAGATVEPAAIPAPSASSGSQASAEKRGPAPSLALVDFPSIPARVFIEHEKDFIFEADKAGARFSSNKAVVEFERDAGSGAAIRVACPNGPLSRVIARWETRSRKTRSISGMRGSAVMAICSGASCSPNASCPGILPRTMRQPGGRSCWE